MTPETIVGGTGKADVPASVFAMPAGMTIRYDQPDPAIAEYVTGYHLYAAARHDGPPQVNWFLPGTANVRITLAAGPVAVQIGSRKFGPLAPVSLFGPTSRAMRTETQGGIMIGFGLSALGWRRLVGRSAHDVHNRIVPLEQLIGRRLPDRLVEALSAAPDEAAVRPILDAVLAPLVLGPGQKDDEAVRALMNLAVDRDVTDAATVAARVGMTPTHVRRLVKNEFGLTPKLLLRRTRFLRTFLASFRQGEARGREAIAEAYYDVSHYLRDASYFLGTTPRRFEAMETPFLDASLRARAAVLGAATQALQVPGQLPR